MFCRRHSSTVTIPALHKQLAHLTAHHADSAAAVC
jgi:hypothetical protein